MLKSQNPSRTKSTVLEGFSYQLFLVDSLLYSWWFYVCFSFRRDIDKPNNSILGYPPEASMMGVSCGLVIVLVYKFIKKKRIVKALRWPVTLDFQPQQYPPPPQFLQPPAGAQTGMQGETCLDTNFGILVPGHCSLLLNLNIKLLWVISPFVPPGDLMTDSTNPVLSSDSSIGRVGYKAKSKAVNILSQSWVVNCTSP